MKPAAKLLLALLTAMPGAAPALGQTPPNQAAIPPEEIGSWRLTCIADRMTDRAECQLRHRDPVERANAAAGSSLLLEVQDRGGRLVPVVIARDLTLEGAGRGLLALTGTAQLRFPPNRYFEFPCGLEGRNLVCAPKPEDAVRAAEELPQASVALVRMVGLGTGGGAEPVELPLQRTRDALVRYRARVPEGSATTPTSGGLTLQDIIQRLMRFWN